MSLSIVFSPEVDAARREGRPLVALETSVIAQGLPHQHNLEAARACEEAVRRARAGPAAIALIEGRVHVGLTVEETRALATAARSSTWKHGARDLPVAMPSGPFE